MVTVGELRGAPAPAAGAGPTTDTDGAPAIAGDGEASDAPASADDPEPVSPPTRLTFIVGAPHAGHYTLRVAYVTDRLPWDVAYTMTATPAREQVTLRGAIAIRNKTKIGFQRARVFVVDAELGPWRGRTAEQLGAKLSGGMASTTPIAAPRALGTLDLGPGETRVELLPGAAPRPMHSVLVYDAVGTELDHSGAAPMRDPSLGVSTPAPVRVTESFEIARDPEATRGLPGGPVRLLERRPDGSLAVLGESRVFDAASRIAEEDTVAVGVAEGVTGRRERRELTIDDDRKRLVEEFVITIANTRARPVEVVLREHLYRGQNWTLAYQTASDAKKEGPQQISLRTTAPAHGEARVLYVVVYTWP